MRCLSCFSFCLVVRLFVCAWYFDHAFSSYSVVTGLFTDSYRAAECETRRHRQRWPHVWWLGSYQWGRVDGLSHKVSYYYNRCRIAFTLWTDVCKHSRWKLHFVSISQAETHQPSHSNRQWKTDTGDRTAQRHSQAGTAPDWREKLYKALHQLNIINWWWMIYETAWTQQKSCGKNRLEKK